jgi:hypothetical protein
VAGPSSLHVTSADMSRFLMIVMMVIHDKWVPVTMACRILRLWMEEHPPIWRVVMNILIKQSWTAANGGPPAWSAEVLTTPQRKNVSCCETVKE